MTRLVLQRITPEHNPLCREVKLVAELLYAGLTTGVGLQTLGEEYCDIIQVAGLLPCSAKL